MVACIRQELLCQKQREKWGFLAARPRVAVFMKLELENDQNRSGSAHLPARSQSFRGRALQTEEPASVRNAENT